MTCYTLYDLNSYRQWHSLITSYEAFERAEYEQLTCYAVYSSWFDEDAEEWVDDKLIKKVEQYED